MKNKPKNIKPEVVNIKPAVNIRPAAKQEQTSQNKFFLVLSFIFLAALLISFMVPVYYVPLFKNISERYGLSSDIARKLTMFDLALNTFGIETPNMAAAFKKQDIEYEPDVFYTSRFESDGSRRLINAKETYYHEYERTKKRPPEIAGIYQDKTAVKTPEIDGDLKGVRALPKGNFDKDDGFTDFSYKKATATTESKDEIMGSKRRQVRGSFDRQGQGANAAQGQANNAKKHEPLPDFAASIYDQKGIGETQTLNNSRMVKPIVSGQDFVVVKPESVIAKLVGDSSFTDTFSALRNFGGYDGALGFYVKDTLPKAGLFDFLGLSGKDVFTSYFYSHAAVGRKYMESSKHLSEIAFHGDEPQDEILVARGQKQDKVPNMDPAEMSPLTLILTVKRNMKQCEDARSTYEQKIRRLRPEYEEAKNKIIDISEGRVTVGSYPNYAWRGAPGSCQCDGNRCQPTMQLRDLWNKNVRTAREKCIAIRNAGIDYANACQMEYTLKDDNKDTCEAINALELDGHEPWFEISDLLPGNRICRVHVKWKNIGTARSFQKCGSEEGIDNCEFRILSSELSNTTPPSCSSDRQQESRNDCVEQIGNLFSEIDNNVKLEGKPGYMFN